MTQASGLVSVLLAGALALALLPGARTEGQEAQRPIHLRIDQPSVIACGGCHERTWREWSESLHHRAWTNANVRTATRDFERAECRSCHSPLPVLSSGLDRAPDYRDFNQEDGVHCLSCHGTADGVAAARTIADAPCRPRFDSAFVSRNLCYPCHEPTHQAYSEYRESDAFAVGLRCADCHFPPRGDQPGRSHGPHGGLNADFVRRGFAAELDLEGDAVLVTLRNRTGHKFPGEIPSRSFVVRLDVKGHAPLYEVLRKPGKTEGRADNRLLPDETRTLSLPLPTGTRPGEIRVRLLWKPFALIPDESAFELLSWHPEKRP